MVSFVPIGAVACVTRHVKSFAAQGISHPVNSVTLGLKGVSRQIAWAAMDLKRDTPRRGLYKLCR